ADKLTVRQAPGRGLRTHGGHYGLLRLDASDRADLQTSTFGALTWRARNLSQKTRRTYHFPHGSVPRSPRGSSEATLDHGDQVDRRYTEIQQSPADLSALFGQ